MDTLTTILNLVCDALDSLDDPNAKLSASIRKAIRIARLRNDYDNLWWLEWEMLSWENEEAKRRIAEEIAPHYTKDKYEYTTNMLVKAYMDERSCMSVSNNGKLITKGKICGMGVEEIEARIENLDMVAKKAVPPEGLHPTDLYFVEREKSKLRANSITLAQDTRAILSRIRQRLHHFLSSTEKQLVYGQLNADFFEQNRRYVDSQLCEIAPKAFDKFVTIYKRVGEGDLEARSHALTSCRRLLKSLADVIYPAVDAPVKGPDGKTRKLTEDRYVSRLWQFVAESIHGKKAGNLVLAEIEDIGHRIDKIYELSCKGVHGDVPLFELNQCVIQTYLVVGDILRLYDQKSAAEAE